MSARWRRLERIGNKLVRCAQVLLSTKGKLVSDENYLAIHPYYKKEVVEGVPGWDFIIGESAVGSELPDLSGKPDNYEEDVWLSLQVLPYTELWDKWRQYGDDYIGGIMHVKRVTSITGVEPWTREDKDGNPNYLIRWSRLHGEEYEKYFSQLAERPTENDIVIEYPEGIVYSWRSTEYDPEEYDDDDFIPYDTFSWGWIPRYVDFVGMYSVNVHATLDSTGVTCGRGDVLAEPVHRELDGAMQFNLGTRVTFIGDLRDRESLSTSIDQTPDSEDEKFYGTIPVESVQLMSNDTTITVGVPDPDMPDGIDYKQGRMG